MSTTYETRSTLGVLARQEIRNYLMHKLFWFGGSMTALVVVAMFVADDPGSAGAYMIGPGAMLGERAHLEGGIRTSTLVAVTDCRVASVEARQFDHDALVELSGGHRREDAGRG